MIGQTLGKYKIIEELGRGGMGRVFRAVNPEIGNQVAIKVLHDYFAEDPGAASRLLQEARATNLISDPGIVRIFEYGQTISGTPYLIMEHLAGEPLSQRLASGGRDPVGNLRLFAQVAAVLSAVHKRGVIHRDLKPENVMIIPDPEVPGGERIKLLDFGLAKLAAEHLGQRNHTEGGVVGTPRYMAPELRLGLEINDKVDVYALGVMLFQLAAGRTPLSNSEARGLIAQRAHADPPSLLKVAPDTPPALASLVAGMLAREPGQRPAMEDVKRSLDQIQRTREPTAPTVEPAGVRPPRRAADPPRRPVSLLLVAFAAVLLLSAASYRRYQAKPRTPADNAAMIAIPGAKAVIGADDARPDERPAHEVLLTAFSMDRTEVTVSNYTKCVTAGHCSAAYQTVWWAGISELQKQVFSQHCNWAKAGREEHPINCVTYEQAAQFCRWAGKRLPTEEEWEYAARGPERRRFPWGDETPTAQHLNACGIECSRAARAQGLQAAARDPVPPMYQEDDGAFATAPVGSFPRGKSYFGLLDMAGNVNEWTSSSFCFYARAPCNSDLQTVRGGSWFNGTTAFVTTFRRERNRPQTRNFHLGFRCAR